MRLEYADDFKDRLSKFPKPIHKKFYKQAEFLLQNLRHPSLHAKKYSESEGVWQARVDRGIRFYFLIEGDKYVLLDIKRHPK